MVWKGRVDGNLKSQLRWHQVVKPFDKHKKEKGICIVGFRCDEGVKRNKGRLGAKDAPISIRKALASLPWHFENLGLYDAGDIEFDGNLESSQMKLAERVAQIKESTLFPVVLGGGHETAFGSIYGIYKATGKMPAIINFDAHFDMRDYSASPSSGTSFRQIGDICKKVNQPFNYLCIGIQKSANTQELFETAKNYGADWIDIEMIRFNVQHAIKHLNEFLKEQESVYLTICSDVFASYLACGVSAPQPFGLEIKEFLTLFYTILKSNKIVGFDISEVNPQLDIDNQTSALAARIIFKLVEGITF
ncbi:formimidoylglutamase [Hippea alviniae]|uniref:formimidoylglutamase n=1 Tax=Hippea alviniae TaxID=1279027 RepID=UPI0003B7B38C|nr:formimidoylglutamase [Hippea alviniae]